MSKTLARCIFLILAAIRLKFNSIGPSQCCITSGIRKVSRFYPDCEDRTNLRDCLLGYCGKLTRKSACESTGSCCFQARLGDHGDSRENGSQDSTRSGVFGCDSDLLQGLGNTRLQNQGSRLRTGDGAALQTLSGRFRSCSIYALSINEAITVTPADKTYARQLKAGEILEKVLAKQPEHPGALHYLIHSYDFPSLANRGLDAAMLYSQIAPSAPHALHMPSHVFSMLGMWEESIQSNQAALLYRRNMFMPWIS